jgi:hypothetical protein
MGTASDAVERLVVHFDQNRSLFLSAAHDKEQLPGVKKPRRWQGFGQHVGQGHRRADAGVYGPARDEPCIGKGA